MTMRHPIDRELTPAKPTFDPVAQYRYTWPGDVERIVTGAQLRELCRGADPDLLQISKVEGPVGESRTTAPELPTDLDELDDPGVKGAKW